MWKQYDNRYSVSNKGEVKDILKDRLVMTNDLNSKGYKRVRLYGKRWFLHRLVATLFIPNPNSLPQVNHKDNNKLNNFVDNLEWCNNQFNNEHSYLNGRMSGRTKLSIDAVNDILSSTLKAKHLASKYNVSVYTIYSVRQGFNTKRLSFVNSHNV